MDIVVSEPPAAKVQPHEAISKPTEDGEWSEEEEDDDDDDDDTAVAMIGIAFLGMVLLAAGGLVYYLLKPPTTAKYTKTAADEANAEKASMLKEDDEDEDEDDDSDDDDDDDEIDEEKGGGGRVAPSPPPTRVVSEPVQPVIEPEPVDPAALAAAEAMRTWLRDAAHIPSGRISSLMSALKEQWVEDLDGLKSNLDVLEKHLPAAAFASIAKAVDAENGGGRDDGPPNGIAGGPAPAMVTPPRKKASRAGLQVKFVWDGQKFDVLLSQEEVKAYTSVQLFVKDLAKRGTAMYAGGGKIKPSTMRVEYKLNDKAAGVKRRVQLTPSSDLSELKRAESILITPYKDS